mgnify:FL=1
MIEISYEAVHSFLSADNRVTKFGLVEIIPDIKQKITYFQSIRQAIRLF